MKLPSCATNTLRTLNVFYLRHNPFLRQKIKQAIIMITCFYFIYFILL